MSKNEKKDHLINKNGFHNKSQQWEYNRKLKIRYATSVANHFAIHYNQSARANVSESQSNM